MPDNPTTTVVSPAVSVSTQNPDLEESAKLMNQLENLRLVDITALYIEIAEKMATHTRTSTAELTKIITSINAANQT